MALFGSIADPRLPALARHLAGALGALPAAVSAVLLDVRRSVCIGLGWLGSKPPEGIYVLVSRACSPSATSLYFLSSCRCSALSRRPSRCRTSISESVLGRESVRRDRMTCDARILAVGLRRLAGGAAGAGLRRRSAEQATAAGASIGRSPVRSATTIAAQLQRGFKIYHEVCSSLSLPATGVVPQPGRSGRPRLHRGAGRGDRGRLQDQGWPERPGRHVRASRPAGRSFPAAVPERARRALRRQRRAAARHVGARQGAPATSAASRGSSSTSFTQYQEQGPDYIVAVLKGYRECARRRDRAAGHALQRILPGHAIAHAAAAAATAGDL